MKRNRSPIKALIQNFGNARFGYAKYFITIQGFIPWLQNQGLTQTQAYALQYILCWPPIIKLGLHARLVTRSRLAYLLSLGPRGTSKVLKVLRELGWIIQLNNPGPGVSVAYSVQPTYDRIIEMPIEEFGQYPEDKILVGKSDITADDLEGIMATFQHPQEIRNYEAYKITVAELIAEHSLSLAQVQSAIDNINNNNQLSIIGVIKNFIQQLDGQPKEPIH